MDKIIEWQMAQQCSDCGEGVHVERIGLGYECDSCGHLHPLDFSQLGDNEEFWVDGFGVLHVRAYA